MSLIYSLYYLQTTYLSPKSFGVLHTRHRILLAKCCKPEFDNKWSLSHYYNNEKQFRVITATYIVTVQLCIFFCYGLWGTMPAIYIKTLSLAAYYIHTYQKDQKLNDMI